MDIGNDYFLCDKCENKNFIRICSFSVRFQEVNYSDDLVYDEIVEEFYQCTHCQKTFSKHSIEKGFKKLIEKRLSSLGSSGGKH